MKLYLFETQDASGTWAPALEIKGTFSEPAAKAKVKQLMRRWAYATQKWRYVAYERMRPSTEVEDKPKEGTFCHVHQTWDFCSQKKRTDVPGGE